MKKVIITTLTLIVVMFLSSCTKEDDLDLCVSDEECNIHEMTNDDVLETNYWNHIKRKTDIENYEGQYHVRLYKLNPDLLTFNLDVSIKDESSLEEVQKWYKLHTDFYNETVEYFDFDKDSKTDQYGGIGVLEFSDLRLQYNFGYDLIIYDEYTLTDTSWQTPLDNVVPILNYLGQEEDFITRYQLKMIQTSTDYLNFHVNIERRFAYADTFNKELSSFPFNESDIEDYLNTNLDVLQVIMK